MKAIIAAALKNTKKRYMGNISFYNLKPQHDEIADALQAACARVMASGAYIMGPELSAFESCFAAYTGTPHCIGVGNGLDALTLILKGLSIGGGDEVIVPAHTFIATWLAVSQAGARPVPVSCDRYFQLDASKLITAITSKTKAIMPVHLYGHPSDINAIKEVIGNRQIAIIEDAAQAQGALYKGKKTGGLGTAAGFSFYPTKNLGCLGDGGAITTNDDALAAKLRKLRNYGSTQKYVHEIQGTNSRLDELQAAFLATKLPYLDRWNDTRKKIAQLYLEQLKDCAHIALPEVAPWADPVWHQFVIRCPKRDELQAHLKVRGIDTLIHYPIANHLQGAYQGRYDEVEYKSYAQLTHAILSLPIYPGLSEEQQSYICESIKKFK